jgi:hypothetical protein
VEIVFDILELRGNFYTLLLDVRPETEPDPALYKDLLLLTEIENPDGSNVRICSWLKSIACVKVTCELNTELKRPIELYNIQKSCNNTAVPLVPEPRPAHPAAALPVEVVPAGGRQRIHERSYEDQAHRARGRGRGGTEASRRLWKAASAFRSAARRRTTSAGWRSTTSESRWSS